LPRLQEHTTFEIEGSFLIEKSLNKNLLVTLTVDDEDKIEFFEVKTPSGKRKMFPTYLDRYVRLPLMMSSILKQVLALYHTNFKHFCTDHVARYLIQFLL